MKLTKKIYITSLLMFFVTSVTHAAWLPERTIVDWYMGPYSASFFVTLDDAIGVPDCPTAKTLRVAGTGTRNQQIFQSVLESQRVQSPIQVFDVYTDTTCNATGDVVTAPLIRFLAP